MSLIVEPLAIPDVKLVRTTRREDERGYFEESFNAAAWREAGIDVTWVQANQSFSRAQGTVRGLHFQLPPAAQAKLVRVARGRVLDVAVDIRRTSAHFGRHVAIVLDASEPVQLFIPAGFAHGFCTLAPDTELAYQVDAHYAPTLDRAILWSDPALGIDWPVSAGKAIVSARDAAAPLLADTSDLFD
jgi:dTDP-4-dehydrorhamnose 3,5-epimerase